MIKMYDRYINMAYFYNMSYCFMREEHYNISLVQYIGAEDSPCSVTFDCFL